MLNQEFQTSKAVNKIDMSCVLSTFIRHYLIFHDVFRMLSIMRLDDFNETDIIIVKFYKSS